MTILRCGRLSKRRGYRQSLTLDSPENGKPEREERRNWKGMSTLKYHEQEGKNTISSTVVSQSFRLSFSLYLSNPHGSALPVARQCLSVCLFDSLSVSQSDN